MERHYVAGVRARITKRLTAVISGSPTIAKSALTAAATLLSASALIAQAPTGNTSIPNTGGFGEEVSVNYVVVPVVVQQENRYLRGLAESDFELRVEGIPIPLQSFDEEFDGPISVAILQDLSGSMAIGGRLESSRALIGCLLERARPGDRYAIATFASGQLEVQVPFSRDLEPIHEQMGLWEPYGTTALHDALLWLPDLTAEANDPRRAALLITDGIDNASGTTPAQSADLLEKAAVPVYSVGIDTGTPFKRNAQGEALFPDADLLERLSSGSGGRYHSLWQPEEVSAVCDQISADLRHQYVLGFTTSDRGRSSYRTIEVNVINNDQKSAQVFYRKGYRGRLPGTTVDPALSRP